MAAHVHHAHPGEPIGANPNRAAGQADDPLAHVARVAMKQVADIPAVTGWKSAVTALDSKKLTNNLLKIPTIPASSLTTRIARFIKEILLKLAHIFSFFRIPQPPQKDDFDILSQLVRGVPDKAQIDSLSVLLPFVSQHLKKRNDAGGNAISKDDKKLADTLAQAGDWAQKIAILQSHPRLTPRSKNMLSLQQEIIKAVEKLAAGEKIVIPSGYQKREGGACEALIEIEKQQHDVFTVKLLSLSDEILPYLAGETHQDTQVTKHNPVMEFGNITTAQLMASINPLITIQLPQIHHQNRQRKDKDFLSILLMGSPFGGQFFGEEEKPAELTVLDVLCSVYKKTPTPAGNMRMKVPYANANKVLLAYFKMVSNDHHYKPLKLEMELSILFQCVNNQFSSLLQNQKLRDLVHTSALKLIHELEKNQNVKDKNLTCLDKDAHAKTLEDLKKVLAAVQQIDQKMYKKDVPPMVLSPLEKKFQLKAALDPNNLQHLSQGNKGTVQTAAFVNLDMKMEGIDKGKISAAKSLKILQSQLAVIKQLYKRADYQSVEVFTADLLRQLPIPAFDEIDFWAQIENDPVVLKQWHQAIFDMAQFMFSAQLLVESPFSQDRIVNQLKTLAIGDRLFVRIAKATGDDAYVDDNHHILRMKQDIKIDSNIYLRFTSAQQHHTVNQLLNYLESPNNDERVNFDLCDSESLLCGNEKGLQYTKKMIHKGFPSEHVSRPEGLARMSKINRYAMQLEAVLPPEILHQRNMTMMFRSLSDHGNYFMTNFTDTIVSMNKAIKAAGSVKNLTEKNAEKTFRQYCLQLIRENRPKIDKVTGERGHYKWVMGIPPFQTAKLILEEANVMQSGIRNEESPNFYKAHGRYLDEKHDKYVHFRFPRQYYIHYNNTNSKYEELSEAALVNQSTEDRDLLMRIIQVNSSRVEQTVAMFIAHPHLLMHPSAQRIFELNVFKQGELLEKLKQQPSFANTLLSFAKQNAERAKQMHDVRTLLFFIRLHDQVRDFVQFADIDEEKKEHILQNFPVLADHERLLKDCGVNLQKKRLVYAALLADYNTKIDNGEFFKINDKIEITKRIVQGHFLWKSLSGGLHDQDPELDAQMRCLMVRLRSELQKIMADATSAKEILQSLIKEMGLHTGQIHEIKGSFPRYSIGHHTFDFEKGMVFEKGKAQGLLTQQILDNEHVQTLFKGKNALSRAAIIEYKRDPETKKEVTIYTFADKPNVRIMQCDNRVIIQMKMKDKDGLLPRNHWYELQPFQKQNPNSEKNQHQLPGEMADLVLGRCIWRQLDNPAHFIVRDETNAKELYDVRLSSHEKGWRLKEVKRTRDGLVLLNPWKDSQNKLFDSEDLFSATNGGALTSIEDPSYIKAWGTPYEVKEFECPRIKTADGSSLTYKLEKAANGSQSLRPVQYPGFVVPFLPASLQVQNSDPNRTIELLPRMFKDYQVLENAKTGTKKVLIPLRNLTREGYTNEETQEKLSRYAHWNDHIRLDANDLTLDRQVLLEFSTNVAGNVLKASTQRDSLYLAYLFFASKHYDQALEYLQVSATSLTMSPSHREIYHWIDQWQDPTPEGISFKLKASLALAEHESKQDIKLPAEELMEIGFRLKTLFVSYEKIKDQLSGNFLLSLEELHCYQQTVDATPAAHYTPLNHPDEIAIESLKPQQWQDPLLEKESYVELAKHLHVHMPVNVLWDEKKLPNNLFFITSDDLFFKHFRTLYNTIYQEKVNSAEYSEIKNIVETARPVSNAAIQARNILRSLILLKEKTGHLETQWELPKHSSMPVAFMRKMSLLRYSTKLLDNFFEKLIKEALPEKTQAEKDAEEAARKTAEEAEKERRAKLPVRKMQIHRDKFLPNERPIDDVCNYSDVREETKKLSRQACEETYHKYSEYELEARVARLSAGLNEPPNKPEKKEAVQQPEQLPAYAVLGLDTTLKDKFFDVNQKQRQIIGNETAFFDPFTKPKQAQHAPEACVQTLAKKYQEDTDYFIAHQKIDSICLKPSISFTDLLSVIRNSLEGENGITAKRKKAEAALLDMLQPKEVLAGQSNLLKPIQNVPKRLIGLFVDNQIAYVNDLYDLKLTPEQIQQLENLLKEWMVLTIQEEAASKGANEVEKIVKDLQPLDGVGKSAYISKLPQEVITDLYSTLAPKRFYALEGPNADPYYRELLAIEYATGFLLRENQVKTIHDMLQDPNQVKQLGMGQGKSSVLLPMLLHRLAKDGDKLAIAVVPEWLYEIVARDLDKSCNALFGQKIIEFKFDRTTPMNMKWLMEHYAALAEPLQKSDAKGTPKPRNAILTTKSYLLSFRNKFIELTNQLHEGNEKNQEELIEQLHLMAKILDLLKKYGAVIGDEIDEIFNIRGELNYAVGAPDELEEASWRMGLRVYTKMLSHPLYGKKILDNEQGSFTPEAIKEIKTFITEQFFDEKSKDPTKRMSEIKGDNDQPIDRKLFCDYIRGEEGLGLPTKNGLPLFMDRLQRDNPALFDEVSFLRQYVAKTLSTTLSYSGNVDYGRSKPPKGDGIETVPYKANNTPNDATFGEQTEWVALFVQDYAQNGLSKEQLRNWINLVLKKINNEMSLQQITQGQMNYRTTETYQKFYGDFGMDPATTYDDLGQLEKLYTYIHTTKAGVTNKLAFLEKWVFPQLKIAKEQVSSNAIDLVNMVRFFGGFTGTTWNLNTYNKKVMVAGAESKGTDGKSIDLLTRMYAEGKLEIRTVPLDPNHLLDSITDAVPNFMDHYDSLIDGGAYLKGVDHEQMVDTLSKKPTSKKKAVVFITPENEKKIQTLGKDDAQPLENRKDIANEQRMSCYDQAHAIGTDIQHERYAKAAVTLSRKIKDLLQNMWRLRLLGQGQTIDIFISEEEAVLIKQARPSTRSGKINIEDLILYCIKNQALVEAEDNLRADTARISSIVPDALMDHLVEVFSRKDSQEIKDEMSLYEDYKDFLLKNVAVSPEVYARLEDPQNTKQALEELRTFLLKIYRGVTNGNAALATLLNPAIESVNTYKFLEEQDLPKQTEAIKNDGKGSQVQTQRQQQQQRQTFMEAEKAEFDSSAWCNWSTPYGLEGLWMNTGYMREAWKGVQFLNEDVRVTANFVPSSKKMDKLSLEEKLLRPHRIPVTQVVVLKKYNQYRYVLLDVLDYEDIVKPAISASNGGDIKAAVYDLRSEENLLFCSTAKDNENPWNDQEMATIAPVLMQLKMYGGQFNTSEPKVLEEWVQSIGPDTLKIYVEEKMLRTVALQLAYDNSMFFKALHGLPLAPEVAV